MTTTLQIIPIVSMARPIVNVIIPRSNHQA